ncbi:MAG: hypothetical protein ACI8VC_001572, partial [Candidatus Endobugula sp.]
PVDTPPFFLHGLNAVYLEGFGWYRVDARGNKPGVSAEFCPPIEKLPYPMVMGYGNEGEADLPEIWAEPLAIIIDALEPGKTFQDVADNLPDVALIS